MEKENKEITLVAGIINATERMLYWKNEGLEIKIGDYAIAENKNGLDLIKVVGLVKTKESSSGRFSFTKYENMKKIVTVFKIDDIK